MKNAIRLARREAGSFINSWTGVLLFVFFLLIAGIFFSLLVISYAQISKEAARNVYEGLRGLGLTRFVFGSFFLNLNIVLAFIVPILSMRVLAEEKRSGTLELLFTYPFSDFEIVWGKFLGLVWIFELLFLPTVAYLGVVHWLGGSLDWRPIAIGYLGFWLLGNAYLALGLFVSSLTESQVTSAVVTFACLLGFWVMDWAVNVSTGFWAHFFTMVSPLRHYREFALGILDLSHVVYFCFFNFFFLFLTLRSIETRNWKG